MFYTNYDFNTIEELERAINDFKFYYKVDKYTINKQTKEYTHNTTQQIVLEMFITKNHNLKLHTKDDTYKIKITHEDDTYKIEFLSKKEEKKYKELQNKINAFVKGLE